MGLFDGILGKGKSDVNFEETTRFGKIKIDEQKKLFKIGFNIFNFEDLLSFELVEDGNEITIGGIDAGRALFGGTFFGNAGAAVGSLSKIKKENKQYCTNIQILFVVKNNKKATQMIPILNLKTDKSKVLYRQSQQLAKETLSGFNYILDSIKPVKTTDAISEYDKLIKLKDLLDKQIITQEEFDQKKATITKSMNS